MAYANIIARGKGGKVTGLIKLIVRQADIDGKRIQESGQASRQK